MIKMIDCQLILMIYGLYNVIDYKMYREKVSKYCVLFILDMRLKDKQWKTCLLIFMCYKYSQDLVCD